MKKYVLCLGLIFGLNPPAYAQMAETIGTLGIYGTMQREGMHNVATMQKSLDRVTFQQDLQELLLEIKMLYGVNFAGISKDAIRYRGFQGINWDISAVSADKFIVKFSQLNGDLCRVCQERQWGTEKVLINEIEGVCRDEGNNVDMYFSAY